MAQIHPTRRQDALRREAPRSIAAIAPRPKPTAAAALLLATALSLPFAGLALLQLLF
ncbi:MAG: hypothetical protein ACX93U_13455 [Salipiger thiooxidans]|uniref:hypothetical protein n=1 Tax=Salipiger thiooxidans TaxID=282683 RepID=UPI001CFB67E2|nr:hypothetical protein [Salipiger thiooxidans]